MAIAPHNPPPSIRRTPNLRSPMDQQTFKSRTKHFALQTIRPVESLPRDRTEDIIGRQLLRSATSVGANYRADCLGRPAPDVVSKLAIVEEEGDESLDWLELLVESGKVSAESAASLLWERNKILSMTAASIKTLRGRYDGRTANPKSKT